MNEKEVKLNTKLAEWAGFKQGKRCGDGEIIFWPPNGSPFVSTLNDYNFTQSLDACFKWLMPKLNEWSISNTERDENEILPYATISYRNHKGKWAYFDEWAETPALALCLAIEKLIDSQPQLEACQRKKKLVDISKLDPGWTPSAARIFRRLFKGGDNGN